MSKKIKSYFYWGAFSLLFTIVIWFTFCLAPFEFDPKFGWSTVVQIFGFIGAIWGVSHQLKKQREMQEERHKVELQLNTYEKIASDIESSSPTGVATSLFIVCSALDNARKKIEEIGEYVPPPFHPDDINNDYREVHTKLWKVAGTIEKYEIISPNLPLFREVLVKKIQELSDEYVPLIQILPYVLLSEKGINDKAKLIILDEAAVRTLEEKITSFSEIAWDIAGFLHDIQIEMQNQLLGNFFNRKLEVRVPNVEGLLVLTSGDEAMLQRARDYLNK